MAMTRMHFDATARTIRSVRADLDTAVDHLFNDLPEHKALVQQLMQHAVDSVAKALCPTFRGFNRAFDASRFQAAAQVSAGRATAVTLALDAAKAAAQAGAYSVEAAPTPAPPTIRPGDVPYEVGQVWLRKDGRRVKVVHVGHYHAEPGRTPSVYVAQTSLNLNSSIGRHSGEGWYTADGRYDQYGHSARDLDRLETQAPAYAAPGCVQLASGQVWRTRGGATAIVTGVETWDDKLYAAVRVEGDGEWSYDARGRWRNGYELHQDAPPLNRDLVELVSAPVAVAA